MTPSAVLIIPTFTALATAALVPLAKLLAGKIGAIDHPGQRKIHNAPVTRLGGTAPALVFWTAAGLGFAALGDPFFQTFLGEGLQDAQRVGPRLLGILLGSFIAFAAGFLDDVLGSRFPFWAKALGQFVGAACVVAGGVSTSFLPHPALNALLTVFWLVGITNAFNLLDNMDGLTSGVALIASSVLLVNALTSGENLIAALTLAFIGVLVGFLFFNFNPATIFLGDCGSHFVGFVLGSLLLLDRYVTSASSSYFPILMPVLLLAVPIIDTTTVVIIRLREGRPIYVGDARHLSHTLVARGFSQKGAVLLIYLMTLGLGLSALPLRDASLAETFIVLLQSSCFIAIILLLMFSGPGPGVQIMIAFLLALAVALPPQAPAVAAGSNYIVSIINERVGEDFSVRFVLSGPPTTYSATRAGDDILVRIEAEALQGLSLPAAAGPIRAMTLEPGPGFSLRISLTERWPHEIVRESASLRLVLRKEGEAVSAPPPIAAAAGVAAVAAAVDDPLVRPSPEPGPPSATADPVAADTSDLYGRLFPSATDPSSVGRLGAATESATPDNWYSDTRWLGFQVRPWLSFSYVDAKTTEVQANNVTADKYWMIQPNFGVGFSPHLGGNRVGQWSVNYTPRFRRALDVDLPHLTSHFFDARIEQPVTSSLAIYGNYHYSQGVLETDEIDPGREYGIGLNRVVDTSLERFKRNSLGVGVRFDFLADTQVDVSVGATKVLYGNDPGEEPVGERAFFDYDTRILNASVRRGLGESRLLGLLFTLNDAPTQPERQQVEGRGYTYGVSLEGEIASLTTGRIQVGYRTQKNPNAGLGGQDYKDFVYGAQIVREISEDTAVGIGADRKLYLSAYEENGYYVADMLRGEFTTQVSPLAVFFRGGLGYQSNSYDTSPQISESTGLPTLRKDKLLLWTLSLTRTLTEWAFLRFDYVGDKRDSNLDRFDIKSRSLSFQIGLGFFGKANSQGAPSW